MSTNDFPGGSGVHKGCGLPNYSKPGERSADDLMPFAAGEVANAGSDCRKLLEARMELMHHRIQLLIRMHGAC